MFTHQFLTTIAFILVLSLPSAHGLLKGSSTNTKTKSIERQGRNLVQQTGSTCDTDTKVKAIGQDDCGIFLSSANGYDDSLVILKEDMACPTREVSDHAIRITASRVTLDCQGHKIEENGRQFGFGLILEGDNIVVQNCEISGFSDGILVFLVQSLNSIVLQNVQSINNSINGLLMDERGGILSSLTILSSNFDNNGSKGMDWEDGSNLLSNLFLLNVTANNNARFGFFLRSTIISTAKFVDVEASNNGFDGITVFGDSSMKLVLHNNTYCGNGQLGFSGNDDDIGNTFIGSFTHQAITCSKDDGKGICDCQC